MIITAHYLLHGLNEVLFVFEVASMGIVPFECQSPVESSLADWTLHVTHRLGIDDVDYWTHNSASQISIFTRLVNFLTGDCLLESFRAKAPANVRSPRSANPRRAVCPPSPVLPQTLSPE